MIHDILPGFYPEDGLRWQNETARFIESLKPDLVVETGIYVGLSTVRILEVLDRNNKGILCSIDPIPQCYIKHDRWRFYPAISLYGMLPVYEHHGPFDVFIHDSDHEVDTQTMEYELAYWLTKPGGWILSDDTTWGTPQHNAWPKFLQRHSLQEVRKFGSCEAVQKPHHAKLSQNHREVLEHAHEAFVLGSKAAQELNYQSKYTFYPEHAWQ